MTFNQDSAMSLLRLYSLPPARSRSKHPQEAFAIIDLLIYSSVLALVSLIVVRTTFPFIESRRLRSAAIELSGYLQVARSVALASNTRCIIHLSPKDGGVFESDTKETINSCNLSENNLAPSLNLSELVASRRLRADVLDKSGTFPITFTPDGTIDAGVTVLLSSTDVSDGVWCVNVEAPLATIRMGWRPGPLDGKDECNYAIEQ